MNKKTLRLIITITIIGLFSLGLNLYLRTEEKKKHTVSPALMASTAVSFAFAAIGSQLPYTSPAAAAIMRRYFLTTITAQTAASTGISLTTRKPSWAKTTTDIGYGLYSAAWVEALRRIPTTAISETNSNIFLKKLLSKLPADVIGRNKFLKGVALYFLVAQAVEVAGKNLAAPAYCAIKQKVGDYTGTLSSEQLEEMAACLSFTE